MGWTVLGTMGFAQWFLEKLATSLGVFQSHLGGDDVVIGREGAVLGLELDAELVISHPDDVQPFYGLPPILAWVVGCVWQVRPEFLVGRLEVGLHPERLEGRRMPQGNFSQFSQSNWARSTFLKRQVLWSRTSAQGIEGTMTARLNMCLSCFSVVKLDREGGASLKHLFTMPQNKWRGDTSECFGMVRKRFLGMQCCGQEISRSIEEQPVEFSPMMSFLLSLERSRY